MKLEKLVVENFRQFKGRQELIFADQRDRNVTVVHAENGFGKTTLLKALTWALYGQSGLTGTDDQQDDFERPNSIIHEGTVQRGGDPALISAMVKLTFKHDDARYTLTRQLTLLQQNHKPGDTDLTLEVTRDGQTFKEGRPQPWINAILPSGIAPLLFFNGERINYLAMAKNSAQVTRAIHQMLGLTLLQNTIEDLKHPNVRGKLRAELRESASSEKQELLQKLTALESQLESQEDALKQCRNNLQGEISELDAIDKKLEANRVSRELQEKRASTQKMMARLEEERAAIVRRLSKLIAEDGYTLFTPSLLERGRTLVNRMRSEGKIPAQVLNTFLQELLDRSLCICKRCLEPESEERKAVETLLTIAGDQDFNNAVGQLDHAMGLMDGISKQTASSLQDLNRQRLQFSRDIRNCAEELDEIHQKLGGKDDEEVQSLEDARKAHELRRDECQHLAGRIQEQIDATIKELELLQAQIRKLEDREDLAAQSQRRVNAVEDCISLIERILAAETEDLRPLLNKEIDSHFRAIMTKDYWAELTDDYVLRIRKHVAGSSEANPGAAIDVALSTGERTVTSLVFIASLVALAERRAEIPTILKNVSGSEYPIAIDSPFGSLSIFREGVARHIPELAPQVLLLVSPEQYRGQVEETLGESGRVGRRYYLKYHGPTIPERATKELILHGQQLTQYVPDRNDEYTEICEL